MNRRQFALGCVLLACASAKGFAQDRIVGAIWEIKNPKTGDLRRFRATTNGKVWSFIRPGDTGVPRVIGTWKGDTENTVMVITGTPDPIYHGKLEIVLVKQEPRTWQGTFKHKSGREIPVEVKLLAD